MYREMTAGHVGDIAEIFTAYRLMQKGCIVHMSSPRSPHDLIVEYEGVVFKVQVKGAAKLEKKGGKETKLFPFCLARGKNSARLYSSNDYDILACVALPYERIIYYPRFKEKARHRISIDELSEEAEHNSWIETIKKVRGQ